VQPLCLVPGVLLAGLLFIPPGPPKLDAPPRERPEPETPVHDVSLEVQALRALHQFRLTPEQLRWLRRLAQETAQPERDRSKAKASADFRRTLAGLRSAFIEDEDEDMIGGLEDKLDQLVENEDPQIDDAVEVTAAARKRAPEVLRRLKPTQLVDFLAARAGEVYDPEDRLVEALDKVRGLDRDEWKSLRDTLAEDLGWALAGVDADRAGRVADQAVGLLSKARGLSDEEFKDRRDDLEKEARALTSRATAEEVLRHLAERAAAQLLSNPRLDAALKARLK
jgi:hypothetical protein